MQLLQSSIMQPRKVGNFLKNSPDSHAPLSREASVGPFQVHGSEEVSGSAREAPGTSSRRAC